MNLFSNDSFSNDDKKHAFKRPSSVDDVRLGNAFSSKEIPKTLRTLNIDQASACVLKTVFGLKVRISYVYHI